MNALRSFDAGVVAQVRGAISHSRRSTRRIACAFRLSRACSSARRTPQTAWKYGIMRGAMNIALPRASLRVVDLAAPTDLVLQHPGERRLGVLLHVARHHGVAPAADGDVERRAGPARVGEARGEADLLDEALGVVGRLDLTRAFAAPALVAVLLDLRRNVPCAIVAREQSAVAELIGGCNISLYAPRMEIPTYGVRARRPHVRSTEPADPAAAEERREIAEEHREAAEEVRQSGEGLRQIAEGVRQARESARQTAEQTRPSSEQPRRNAEHVRQASEEARAAAARSLGARDDIVAATDAVRETLADQQRQLDALRPKTADIALPRSSNPCPRDDSVV